MKKVIIAIISILICIVIGGGIYLFFNNLAKNNPSDVLEEFYSLVENKEYEKMYDLITVESKEKISQEEFVTRNKNIYEGIDINSLELESLKFSQEKSNKCEIKYIEKMDTIAGIIEFSNLCELQKDSDKNYKIVWDSSLIFPELQNDYKVKVNKDYAVRGNILDRNENFLAYQGNVSNIGIVPGKLGENKEENISKISELLDISVESINKTLSSSWVKDDSFVPLKKVSFDETELKENLLQVQGVKISSVKDRVYPYGEATAHLTGYIRGITAEELEKNSGKGYNSNSVIGKAGLEKQYEERLKGKDGVEIYIVDSNGNNVKTLAKTEKQDGENIKLTIDIGIQKKLYDELKNDAGFFVVMDPYTGGLLALVSTPSYDPNKFVLGMSDEEWKEISKNEANPMYTRYLQTWCPGSTFKPVTGAIGLNSGTLSENDEFTYSGLAWKKDASWGNYEITTLTAYNSSKNLRNALIHSDNIYFAQASLKIGAEKFTEGLNKIKFGEDLNILNASKSTYSNSEKIEKETQLADSGYGQGQILVNPIHMASIYSSFKNNGNMIKPYIEYKESNELEYLVENAFSEKVANIIKDDLIQVIEHPEGTAKDMKIEGITLAGKTGTAELKVSKEEKGKTLGWFDCFTVDGTGNEMLIISMVENAQENGGSHYLIKKIRTLFE